jgi:hypothetical protein
MKEDQKDSNKKTTSNPKDEQNKELFTKHPAPKKYRNKSVNKYKVNINPNIKRNLINNNLNLLGSLGIDKNVQDLIVNQNKNLNYNNNVPNMPARKRTKTMHLKNQNNIKPEINSYNNVNQVINHNVNRHFFGQEVYDNSFENYGSLFDDRFINNYSSNFRSNLEKDIFNFLMNIIQGNRFDSVGKKHPPTKESVLHNLKKFDLSEIYCKKTEKGYEYPNCCICINDIALKQRAVLLPCGHLLHWKCGEIWLKKNNTCPLCRFELPGEKMK